MKGEKYKSLFLGISRVSLDFIGLGNNNTTKGKWEQSKQVLNSSHDFEGTFDFIG
jgi:hypothetical protein